MRTTERDCSRLPQRNIAELFESEARRRPEATAVGSALTTRYAELNRRATRSRIIFANAIACTDMPIGVCSTVPQLTSRY